MEHRWETKLDSLGFVDNRKCVRCGVVEERANMPGSLGIWIAKDYKPTPKCIDSEQEAIRLMNKVFAKELSSYQPSYRYFADRRSKDMYFWTTQKK